jgi:hypothetical protein
MDECKKLQGEKAMFLDQVRRLESQVEMMGHDKQQGELLMSQLRREKDELQKEVTEMRDLLLVEQKKLEQNYKLYSEQMQEMYVKE